MKDQIVRLLRQGKAVGAEVPAIRSDCRAFIRVNKLARGGYAIVHYEMSEKVIEQLRQRWDENEDYLDKRSDIVPDLTQVDDVLQRWGLDPEILSPAWQVDAP
jgi:hypothetical protein